MDRLFAIALGLLLVVTALPAQGAPDGDRVGQGDEWQVVVTSDGVELVPGGSVPLGATYAECEASAPDETHCETGLHVGSEVWSVTSGSSSDFTGTTEVRLFHATSVLVVQVNFINGEFAGSHVYGQFPGSPSVFWHECFSYELGAAGDNWLPLPFEENGTPGGAGDFRCGVLYV